MPIANLPEQRAAVSKERGKGGGSNLRKPSFGVRSMWTTFVFFPLLFVSQFLWGKEKDYPESFNLMASLRSRQGFTRGFTLAEMVVGIAIVGILAGIAIPTFVSQMPKFRLNGAARQIMGDLMAARMQAVSQGRKVKVFFSSPYYTISDDANGNGTVTNGEGDSRTINIQDNYSNVTFTFTINPVFNPRGTATPSGVLLSNSGESRAITVTIAGRVKIYG